MVSRPWYARNTTPIPPPRAGPQRHRKPEKCLSPYHASPYNHSVVVIVRMNPNLMLLKSELAGPTRSPVSGKNKAALALYLIEGEAPYKLSGVKRLRWAYKIPQLILNT